jgi:orotate phosphoribosyltransferase
VQTDSLAELARDIDRTCRLTGRFTLRSGQTATEYFDKYLFESDPRLLRRVAEAMQPLVPNDTDLLGGLELGGIPLATMISSLTGIPALFVRKQAKEYGTRRLAEGADVAGRRITIVEDIVTTGGAVRDATRALRAAGAIVETAICAIDRSPNPGTALTDVQLTTLPLLTRHDLDQAHRAHRG